MKDAQKEFKGCPLPCEKKIKNPTLCRRTSCHELDQYLKNIPCYSCPQYRKKICKVDCPKVIQWNETYHWREDVGEDFRWDSRHHRFRFPDELQEDVTISPSNKIPENVLKEIKEKSYPQPQEETIKKYARVTIGKKRRSYVILNPNALKEGWVEKKIKKLPANAVIVEDIKLRKGYVVDELIAKVSQRLADTRSIPYEDALIIVYKTSRPCKNPDCPSRIPHKRFGVDRRTRFCCDACRKSYQRSKA